MAVQVGPENESCSQCVCFFSGHMGGGFCHRRAPIVTGTSEHGASPSWPSVNGGDWCGEYEPKERT